MTEVARYETRDRRHRLITGFAQTVNISSSGVLLRVQHRISVGNPLELWLEWPALLDGCVRLQLLAQGRVVRAEPGTIALMFDSHEFRTCKTADTSGRRVS
jgi:hypothetical protein